MQREVESRIVEYERELRLSLSGVSDMTQAKPELIQIAS
jgi:hypothetical protein